MRTQLKAAEKQVQSSPSFQHGVGLDILYDHFIKELNGDPIPFGKTEKLHIVCEIVGASAGIYSIEPSWEYGQNQAPWFRYSLTIANPLSNVLFLMKATDDMLNIISMEMMVPPELSTVLKPMDKTSLAVKQIKLILGSLVCSVPFAITTYLFPFPNCVSPTCLGTTVTHSLLTNMILHAISWNFILTPELWYYRLPFIPLEKLYNCFRTGPCNLINAILWNIKMN